MIAVIDMGMGNLRSVSEAFKRIGINVHVTGRPDDIEKADAVVLPGVGSFGDGMASLNEKNLITPLRLHATVENKPILGICLGMQLMAQNGHEHGIHRGLGIIEGEVVRLSPAEKGCRVPNIGWCDITIKKRDGLFRGTRDNSSFYFVHSYYLQCTHESDIAAVIEYSGQNITAAIERGNIFGVQFHPEKSQDEGLQLLDAFIEHLKKGCLK